MLRVVMGEVVEVLSRFGRILRSYWESCGVEVVEVCPLVLLSLAVAGAEGRCLHCCSLLVGAADRRVSYSHRKPEGQRVYQVRLQVTRLREVSLAVAAEVEALHYCG
jgi:hypothetical protein